MQVLGLARASEGAVRQRFLLVLEVAPQRVERLEVGALALEPGVRLVGLGLLVDRPLSRVLDGQGRDDDEHLTGAAEPAGLDDHPREPRVERQPRQGATGCREPPTAPPVPAPLFVTDRERAELFEQADPIGDLAGVGRVDEREAGDVAEPERRHLQDDRGQRGALDLGLGELGPGVEVLFRVQPDAHAGGDAPAPAGALRRAGLADRLDGQSLHLGPLAVAGDAGGAGVHDVTDAGHGERGLGDVRREDDPAPAPPVEDAVLLGRGEPGEQRQHLGVRELQGGERLRRVPDLTLPGEEREDVGGLGARRGLGPELLDGLDDAGHLVALDDDVPSLRVQLEQGSVAHLDGVRPAGDLDDRNLAHLVPALVGREVQGEPHGVDRRRGDDHPQLGAARQQLLEVAEDEVDVEAALVGLVDDDRVVATQVAVALHLGEQDAVGHHLQPGRVAAVVGEPHLVADEVAELDLHLLGDPLRDGAGGDPPGLGVPDLAGRAETQLEAHLGQLGRLAGAGLTGDDDDLVVADRGEDVLAPLDDRQVLGVPQPRGVDRIDRVDELGRHPPSLIRPVLPDLSRCALAREPPPGHRGRAGRGPAPRVELESHPSEARPWTC